MGRRWGGLERVLLLVAAAAAGAGGGRGHAPCSSGSGSCLLAVLREPAVTRVTAL